MINYSVHPCRAAPLGPGLGRGRERTKNRDPTIPTPPAISGAPARTNDQRTRLGVSGPHAHASWGTLIHLVSLSLDLPFFRTLPWRMAGAGEIQGSSSGAGWRPQSCSEHDEHSFNKVHPVTHARPWPRGSKLRASGSAWSQSRIALARAGQFALTGSGKSKA